MRCTRLCLLLLAVTLASGEIKNKGWWRNTVFYQIYPRSFMDSDNDGLGDLKGVTLKMDHFGDAGVGAIWFSPIFDSPMIDFGYDISDFIKIDKTFGTMEDFEELIARAREHGLKVILDFVPNHTSDKHEWFQKCLAGVQKYCDYYVWRAGKNNDGKVPPNNWISAFSGPAWEYNSTFNKWYLHQFEYRQPDLNFSNPEVRAEMEEILRFWLRKGVDGFRVDSANFLFEDSQFRDEPRSYAPGLTDRDYYYLKHIYTTDDQRTYDIFADWRKVLDDFSNENNADEKILMTEAYTTLENTVKYYKYGTNVPFNFIFIKNITASSTPDDYKHAIDNWSAHVPNGEVANWVTGNHDNHRPASRFPGRGDQLTMLSMILPGIAVTYNGDEIGMVDKDDISWEETKDPQACNAGKDKFQSESRDPERTPFQWDDSIDAGFSRAASTWLPVNENYKQLNLANQRAANESHYKIFQALTQLRKTSPALQGTSYKTVVLSNNTVLAVVRENDAESVILLINFENDEPQTVDLRKLATLHNRTVVEITSLGSPVKPGTQINAGQVTVPGKHSLVVISSN